MLPFASTCSIYSTYIAKHALETEVKWSVIVNNNQACKRERLDTYAELSQSNSTETLNKARTSSLIQHLKTTKV